MRTTTEPGNTRRNLVALGIIQILIGIVSVCYIWGWRNKVTFFSPEEVRSVTMELYRSLFEVFSTVTFRIIPGLSVVLIISGIGVLIIVAKQISSEREQ